jgi:hypothetical protein
VGQRNLCVMASTKVPTPLCHGKHQSTHTTLSWQASKHPHHFVMVSNKAPTPLVMASTKAPIQLGQLGHEA